MNYEYGVLVEWYWQAKTKVGKNMSHCDFVHHESHIG